MGQLVTENKILMVFTIYEHGDHTDHVTGRFDIFSFAAPWRLYMKLISIGSVAFEETYYDSPRPKVKMISASCTHKFSKIH